MELLSERTMDTAVQLFEVPVPRRSKHSETEPNMRARGSLCSLCRNRDLGRLRGLTWRFCWSRSSRSGVRTGPAGACAGSSHTSCTSACLRGSWPESSSGSPACCPPERTAEKAPGPPLIRNRTGLSGACSRAQTLPGVIFERTASDASSLFLRCIQARAPAYVTNPRRPRAFTWRQRTPGSYGKPGEHDWGENLIRQQLDWTEPPKQRQHRKWRRVFKRVFFNYYSWTRCFTLHLFVYECVYMYPTFIEKLFKICVKQHNLNLYSYLKKTCLLSPSFF